MLKSCFGTRVEKRAAFESADIYPVISSEFCLGRPVEEIFRAVAEGGAKVVQLREKHLGKKALYELAVRCRSIANEFGILLIIDDHADVAVAANADGVHLGQDDLPIAAARTLSESLWIGNSTHNLEEALRAQREGADCINIGPIYPTQTKSVNCIKLLVKNSIEEKVLELQRMKAGLFNNLVEAPSEAMRGMSMEDFEFLLKD